MKNPVIIGAPTAAHPVTVKRDGSTVGQRATSHTPPPWRIATDTGPCVISNGVREIGECYEDGEVQIAEDEANAAHIVRCVNAHAELVAALVRIRSLIAEDVGIASLIAREALLKVQA